MPCHYSSNALELPKILERLAGEASCKESAELANSLKPVSDPDQVALLLDQTNTAYTLTIQYGAPSFYGLKSVIPELKRAEVGASLSMKELLDVAGVLSIIRGVRRWRDSQKEDATKLDFYFSSLSPNKFLEDEITSAILSEDEMADQASSELAGIRRKKKNLSVRIRESLDKVIRSPSYSKFLQEPVVTIRDGRFVVPVRAEYRSEIHGLVHDTSASGSTLFVEPLASVEANNELRLLQNQEELEIARILSALSAAVGEFAGKISADNKVLITLDFIFAKSKLARKMNAVLPLLNDTGYISLHSARHPLIDAHKVVPIDITLGGDFDTLVITGPNTGGKTVALKTLGLLTLMAMCGLMIPADHPSSISIFDCVFADIGDEQSIEQSLSTFSSHMKNIVKIIGQAGYGSLVLFDELGSGTDPAEGAALAETIIEYLREKRVLIAATTHYAELKLFALEHTGIQNASCEFDLATLQPTYRLLIGIPGRSNAFAISERLGLPASLVERAKNYLSNENNRFEDVISDLQASRQEIEHEREESKRLKAEAERTVKSLETQKKELEKETERIKEKARAEAKRILETTRVKSAELLAGLEEYRHKAEKEEKSDFLRQARSQMSSAIKDLENITDPIIKKHPSAPYRLPRSLRIGDPVLIIDIDKKAIVTSSVKDGIAEVTAGIIKMRVPISNLKLEDQPLPAGKPPARRNTATLKNRDVHQELDLRGMTVAEALPELDRFIDQCVMSGLLQATIIHGKGTGALRAAVQEELKRNRSVKGFRLGVYGEGENGVTIIEL